jgi:hypothetical protein
VAAAILAEHHILLQHGPLSSSVQFGHLYKSMLKPGEGCKLRDILVSSLTCVVSRRLVRVKGLGCSSMRARACACTHLRTCVRVDFPLVFSLCACTHAHARARAHTGTQHTRVYTRTRARTCTCMHAGVHEREQACIHACW